MSLALYRILEWENGSGRVNAAKLLVLNLDSSFNRFHLLL